MKYFLPVLFLLLLAAGIAVLPACGGGGSDGGPGTLIADFDLEGEEYVADPFNPFEKMCMIFKQRMAYAWADLGFDSNSYPFNQFFGESNAQGTLVVTISAPDAAFVAQGETNTNGRITFSDLPSGFLNMTITGSEGNNYNIPIHISPGMTSRTQALIFSNTNGVLVSAKTIHDDNGDGVNDDDFSYALFNRPRNSQFGGVVHLHVDNETKVDANGDGDFLDAGDRTVIEPDDDGVSSDEGDKDEDNDGILDGEDDDCDGDGILNAPDPDSDGDGINDIDDEFPCGESPNDDFDPPVRADTGGEYDGVAYVEETGTEMVTVWFPDAMDVMSEPVTYNIYYSPTTPVDTDTAMLQRFTPTLPPQPGDDGKYSDNVIGLTAGQAWYFVVRVQDASMPPNEDYNSEEFEIFLQ